MARAIKLLTDDIYFGEAPRWHRGRLWFSDFYAHAVKSVSPAGDLRTEFEIDDQPSGLGWMPDGSMLIVSMTKRQVLRRTSDGSMTVHADLNHIASFHCNDMVIDSQGRAFVGNFGFDLDAEVARRGIDGVIADHGTAAIARVDPDGRVSIAASGLHFPNGSVITADGKTLIVGETLSGELTAFDLGREGTLGNRRCWARTTPRAPDGICLDAEGAIWIANPFAPECVRIAPGGRVLEVIDTEFPCFACMLGGDEGTTLFMLTCTAFDSRDAAARPTGRLVMTEVEVGHAGTP